MDDGDLVALLAALVIRDRPDRNIPDAVEVAEAIVDEVLNRGRTVGGRNLDRECEDALLVKERAAAKQRVALLRARGRPG